LRALSLFPFGGLGLLLSSGAVGDHLQKRNGGSEVEEGLGFGNGNFEKVKV